MRRLRPRRRGWLTWQGWVVVIYLAAWAGVIAWLGWEVVG